MLQTRKSNPAKPVRIMPYGVEGVGKSTLGALAERPVFISPEGGTDQLRTASGESVDEIIPPVKNWDGLRSSIRSLASEDHSFKTLVLDSADWIEGLAHKKIIGTSGKTITTVNGGYGSGYRESQNMHQELIADLSDLRDKKDMNIIVTAHAHVKPVKDPESIHDYDSFEIKCHEMVSSLWREWVDGLFFIRFSTITKTSDETNKARAVSDGSRVLYTVKQPACQAKNRYGLPPVMNFTTDFWNEFMSYARKGIVTESADQIKNEMAELFVLLPSQELKNKVGESIEKAGEDVSKLLPIRARLREITNQKGA